MIREGGGDRQRVIALPPPVEHRQHPDHIAAVVDDRGRQYRVGDIADPLGHVAGEARVARDLIDDQCLTSSGNVPGDALGNG